MVSTSAVGDVCSCDMYYSTEHAYLGKTRVRNLSKPFPFIAFRDYDIAIVDSQNPIQVDRLRIFRASRNNLLASRVS